MANRQKPKQKTRHAGVYRLDGGGWRIEATQRDHEGARVFRRKNLPADLSLEDAARERARLVAALDLEIEQKAERARAQASGVPTRLDTVSSYSARWLARKVTSGDLRESSQGRYIQALSSAILPVIGEVELRDLTRDHVERWLGWARSQRTKRGEPYAQDTLRGWWRILVLLLRDAAVELGLPDPTARLAAPKSPVRRCREQRTLTPAQLGALLGALRVHHQDWYDEAFTLMFTGVRPGELYALGWEDRDDAEGVLHVRRAVSRKGTVGLTKTSDPRDVAMVAPVRELLSARLRRMIAEQHPGLASGLMFPTIKGGHRQAPALLKVLEQCRKEIGIQSRVGPQVLRRTLNTLLVEQGVSNIVIQQQIGHVSDEMTSLYAGVHAEAKRRAVDGVFRSVAGRDGEPA